MLDSSWIARLASPDLPNEPPEVGDRKPILQVRLQRLQSRQRYRVRLKRLALVVVILLLALIPILYPVVRSFSDGEDARLAALVAAGYAVLALAFSLSIPSNEYDNEIHQTEDELDLLGCENISAEQRAQKLLKLHQFELKRYYDLTLKESSRIYLVGIGCIFLGFAIIGFTLYLVGYRLAGAKWQEKLLVSTLGSIGGILSNFIAVVFLKMFAETTKCLTEFHNRLVLTHHLHFGNFLIAKIEAPKLREESLSQMALHLADSVLGRPEMQTGADHSADAKGKQERTSPLLEHTPS